MHTLQHLQWPKMRSETRTSCFERIHEIRIDVIVIVFLQTPILHFFSQNTITQSLNQSASLVNYSLKKTKSKFFRKSSSFLSCVLTSPSPQISETSDPNVSSQKSSNHKKISFFSKRARLSPKRERERERSTQHTHTYKN